MRNAKKFDERITIGLVPTFEDLEQLRDNGYRTLVDLRDESERFGGEVGRLATELGMRYVSVPIGRDAIELDAVVGFYRVVFARGVAPLYLFSRFGKKPLAFLLLLEAIAQGDRVQTIYRRASRFGTSLGGDICLQDFLVGVLNGDQINPVYESLRTLRPDLLEPRRSRPSAASHSSGTEPIRAALTDISEQWVRTGDREALRAALERIVATLG